MAPKEAKKEIKDVVIEYADGTQDVLDEYAAVGYSEANHTWHKVMLSPAKDEAKINMNNLLVELAESLRRALAAKK